MGGGGEVDFGKGYAPTTYRYILQPTKASGILSPFLPHPPMHCANLSSVKRNLPSVFSFFGGVTFLFCSPFSRLVSLSFLSLSGEARDERRGERFMFWGGTLFPFFLWSGFGRCETTSKSDVARGMGFFTCHKKRIDCSLLLPVYCIFLP